MVTVKTDETYDYSIKGECPRKVRVLDQQKDGRVRVLFCSTGKQMTVSKAHLSPHYAGSDERNPEMALQGVSTELLKQFASGKLDALSYIKYELENRGVKA